MCQAHFVPVRPALLVPEARRVKHLVQDGPEADAPAPEGKDLGVPDIFF